MEAGGGRKEGIVYRATLRRIRGDPILFFMEGSSVVTAAKLRWERLLQWLEGLGFTREGECSWSTSSATWFLEAVVVFGVAQTMRKPDKLSLLRSIVDELELLELRFWANALSEGYRRAGRRGMYRPARAFKVLYRLAR